MISTSSSTDDEATTSVLGEIKPNRQVQQNSERESRIHIRNRANSTDRGMDVRVRQRQRAITGWQERQLYARAGQPASLPSSLPSDEYGKENNFFMTPSYEDEFYNTYE